MVFEAIVLAAFTLVGAEKSVKVVMPEKPTLSTPLAVEEFTNYVARATGRVLEVEKIGGGGQRNVIVGTVETLGDALPETIRTALAARSEVEAFWCGTVDGALWIVGKNETAETRGVYWFLEHKLGVRWFKIATKEDPGDCVPEAKTLVLDDFSVCLAPRFELRELGQTGSWGCVIPKEGMRLVYRLGFQVYPGYGGPVPYDQPKSEFSQYFAPRVVRRWQTCAGGGGHCTIMSVIKPEKYFDSHPEYFALVDGKRRKDCCYCLTNPDVATLTASNIVAGFKKIGGRGRFTFGQWDVTGGFCQCDRCRAAAGKDAKMNDISRSFGLFVKDVAARVWKECPDAELTLWAEYR